MCAAAICQAQADRGLLRDGNRSYNKKQYDKADVFYRKALEKDSMDYRGQYNLGNALYRQGKYDEAIRHLEQASATNGISNHQRARTLHNLGNSHASKGIAVLKDGEGNPESLQQGIAQLQQAATAYRESLKLEPKDEDTRYNLAYTMRLLQQAQQQQQQQQQQGNGDGDKQDKKNGQDQQGQNGDDKQDDQQQQNNQQQNNQQQQPENGKERKGNEGREQKQQDMKDAERLLEAVKNNERQTMREQNRKVQVGKAKHTDKDW